MRLLLLLVALVLLTGCEGRSLGWIDYTGDVMKATANGAVTGGPIGGLLGLITGLFTARVSNRRRDAKINRREKVIETYRRKHGNLSPRDFRAATGASHAHA